MLIHISVVIAGDCEVVAMVVVEAAVVVAAVVVAAVVVAAVVVAAVVVATGAGSVMTENDIEIDMMSSGTPKSLVAGICGGAVDIRGVTVGASVASIAGMVSGKTVASGALIDNAISTIGSAGTTEEVAEEAVGGIVKIGGVRMGGRLKLMDGITIETSVVLRVSVVESAVPSKMFAVPGCN